MDEIEEDYTHLVFRLEQELGHYIDEDYPLMKFWEEAQELEWYSKKQEELNNRF